MRPLPSRFIEGMTTWASEINEMVLMLISLVIPSTVAASIEAGMQYPATCARRVTSLLSIAALTRSAASAGFERSARTNSSL
jgi:hypothetical protein